MAAEYTQDSTNARALMANFAAGGLIVGSLAFGATAATDALIHGLGAAPDFVILSPNGETGGTNLKWSSDATTITITRATTVGAETWNYIMGILA